MSEVFVVGGTFDRSGGKPSFIVGRLITLLGCEGVNGGDLAEVEALPDNLPAGTKALIWMPNIDNWEDKLLPVIKKKNPFLTLVSSKRIIEKDYAWWDVVLRLLKTRSNLGITIHKEDGHYQFSLLDPLGNLHLEKSESVEKLAAAIKDRLRTLRAVTRVGSIRRGEAGPIDIPIEFLDYVRETGVLFGKLWDGAINKERFMGNAAVRTRCMAGFPAMRSGDTVLVSRRNVEKATIGPDDFVPVEHVSRLRLGYYGQNKPSVDAPAEVELFFALPRIQYMIHGHVYVKGAPYTRIALPCGALQEVTEVLLALAQHHELSAQHHELYESELKDLDSFAVNLLGHGCLVGAATLEQLQQFQFVARDFPENLVVEPETCQYELSPAEST